MWWMVLVAFVATVAIVLSVLAIVWSFRGGRQGSSGRRGRAGATGAAGVLTANYISSYSTGMQPVGAAQVAVQFTTDRATSNTIVRSTSGTEFTVPTTGLYFIAWSTSVVDGADAPTTYLAYLTLSVNGVEQLPNILNAVGSSIEALPPFVGTLSGSLLIPLAAADVVQLHVQSVNPAMSLEHPIISIQQTA